MIYVHLKTVTTLNRDQGVIILEVKPYNTASTSSK